MPYQFQTARPLQSHALLNDQSAESKSVHGTKFSLEIFYSAHIWLEELDGHQTHGQCCEFN